MPVAVATLIVGLLHNMQNYGALRRCSIRPVFDPELRPKGAHGRGQDREPVERPFHHLWTDGGETEKRPPCPPRVIEPAQNYGSYFWDTTLTYIRRSSLK